MKEIKIKNVSLRIHLWVYFCSFTVAVMVILWIIQIFFLNAFFKSMKLSELKKIGHQITEQYELKEENFGRYWMRHSSNGGVFAHIINEDGEIERNSLVIPEAGEPDGKLGEPHGAPRRMVDNDYFNSFVSKISAAKEKEAAYVEESERMGATFAVYGAYIGKRGGKNMYLYLTSPLERTDTTRKVLQTQLLIASALSLFLSLILAYFVAKRHSGSIEKATAGARELAKGNYDITFEHGSYREINELADTLNYTAVELSKTEELRRDLIANVSHDLKTPLTIIKSYAEMIRDISGSNEEKRNKHTGVIIDEANRLSLLVNDMLDLSQMQSGTTKMRLEAFDINFAVTAIADSLEYYREREGYKFIIHTDAKHNVIGDSRKISQVIYNLVANAINYTGNDKMIYIDTFDTESGVKFTVRDTGKGIPSGEVPRVWDKYYKSSGTHTRQNVGTGIGLSIVRNILDAHNAAYGVDTRENQGSVFWFELKKADF